MAQSKKKLILISNDDGIRAEGIKKLKSCLKDLGDIYVVAPDREQSASSHSLTLHRPLRIDKVRPREFQVDGTPTDCVTLAARSVLPRLPDLIVSGINKGQNLGEDVLYSGTVSAAMEGLVLGIPSIAFSQVGPIGGLPGEEEKFNYSSGIDFIKRLCKKVLKEGLPKETLLNVNIPHVGKGKKLKGWRITTQGSRIFGDVITEQTDPRGKKYYWIGGTIESYEGPPDSDFKAVQDGYASITPVHLDMTHVKSIKKLESWKF